MNGASFKRIGLIALLPAAFWIVFVSSLSLWGGEATSSKEDLLVLAEQQQSLIQDIQATVDYDCVKIEGNAEGIWRRNRLTFKIKGAKQYILEEGAHDLEAEEFESREEKAYDGKISTLLFPGGNLANIREGKADEIVGAYYLILGMAMMQGVVKGEAQDDPSVDLPALLRMKWSRVREATEKIDGRDCHVVDSMYDGKPTFTVWLDVERGCIPLLRRGYRPDGSLIREIRTTKLWNFGDGLWLPVAGRSILVFSDHRSEFVINALDSATGKPRVKVNSGIKDDEFKVKIPPGTLVVDSYAGIGYSEPAIKPEEFIEPITEKPQKIEAPVVQEKVATPEAEAPVAEPQVAVAQTTPSSSKRTTYVITGVAALVLLLAIVFLILRRKAVPR